MIEFDAGVARDAFRVDARFAAPAAATTALFGASGAGKSTLLALLAGALRPDRGSIRIDGEVVADAATGRHLPLEKRRIAWVFQDGRLFPHLTVARNLDYGLARLPRGAARRFARERVIEVLDVGALLGRWPRDLSGGERQRVAIGRALLAQPRLLLLDEPLASLDAPRRLEILGFLERARGEFPLSMVYVTHSLAEVLRIADRMVLLERGRVVGEGPPAELAGRLDTPLLAARADAGALLQTRLAGHEPDGSASWLEFGEGRLLAPRLAAAAGTPVRAYVLASEVMLATERPHGLSVRNVLPATVRRVAARPDATELVELDCCGQRLLAAVSRGAVLELRLEAGREVFALVKTVAIDAPAGGRMLLEH
ncbi:MAG: molybdenum ABC transporter ATP-binding protein [Gammaproteobacteria bacterium]|nr:molybdenum ABC transporter ATP-binding protein [Gammaproteobacteria bacterium]